MKQNVEQLEAMHATAVENNPNKERIATLRAQQAKIDEELSMLVSDGEKAAAMQVWYARVEETDRIVTALNNQELGELIVNEVIADLATDSMGSAAVNEALRRLGYECFDDGSDEE